MQIRQQFVAVKELHGKAFQMLLLLLSFVCCAAVAVVALLHNNNNNNNKLFLFCCISFYLKTIDNKGNFHFVKVTHKY